MSRSGAERFAWVALGGIAVALALRALAHWIGAIASRGPVLYGEGAVANAARILAAGGDPYAVEPAGTFVAANYPPLAFVIGALGAAIGPFVALRIVSAIAVLAVATLIFWRGGRDTRAAALGLTFLALFPVQVWGAAHKPDPLAVALVAFAVVAAGPSWGRAGAAGLCGALAVLAKPTALVPLAAVALYLFLREPLAARRTTVAASIALAAGLAATVARSGIAGPLEHIVARNALPVSLDALVAIIVVGGVCLGPGVVLATRPGDGRMRAYLAGAAGVAMLGAREGATINYLLDLGAASLLAIAVARPRPLLTGAALAVQLVVAVAVFRPFTPEAVTGRWADPARAAIAAGLSRDAPHLAEDSGVLVANRIEPRVDDLFLWSRLVGSGARADDITPAVREGRFATVLAEVDLSALERAPGYERQRWSPQLAQAVLSAYRLDSQQAGTFRYVPARAALR